VASTVVALAAIGLGCGDSARNDQGVSFTFFGWFSDTDGSTGVASVSMPISSTVETPGFANDVVLFAGLQNNLVGQFVRTERMFHSYFVPGASTTIPDTSVA